MILILLIKRLELLIVFFLLVLSIFSLSRLTFRLALKNLKPFLWLFILTFVLHGFFSEGKIIWRVPYIKATITDEGILTGLFYTFRIAILIILANLLTLTTSPMSLTDAIGRFLSPWKRLGLPAHEIALMISISLRFIPILLDETERIKRAQISRGIHFNGNIIHKLRCVIPIIIPLFLSAFRRANDLALAMDARCYHGDQGRTSYYCLKFQLSDIVAFLSVIILIVPVVIFR
jgi:energy-coupling factor transport system permease protein